MSVFERWEALLEPTPPTAIVASKDVHDELWAALAPQARYVDGYVKYPTYCDVDIIVDTQTTNRLEAIR